MEGHPLGACQGAGSLPRDDLLPAACPSAAEEASLPVDPHGPSKPPCPARHPYGSALNRMNRAEGGRARPVIQSPTHNPTNLNCQPTKLRGCRLSEQQTARPFDMHSFLKVSVWNLEPSRHSLPSGEGTAQL
jgi:hypothetical protein